jgi:hypothetical protein
VIASLGLVYAGIALQMIFMIVFEFRTLILPGSENEGRSKVRKGRG